MESFVSPGLHVMMLAERADADGIDQLTARQQTVVWVSSSHMVVWGEGFGALIESEWPFPPIAAAFREVGLGAIAASIEQVAGQLAARPEASESQKREGLLAQAGPRGFQRAEAAMRAVDAWALDEILTTYMDRYPLDFPEIQVPPDTLLPA